ncbi:adenosine kinase [Pseudochelatococcus contaminans]|uniref:Adenosine kinase n=1 Tax=Pseudochelatococcus contaminans TaxID=1538103 RepID=A0A7W5Z3A4_9HYPH|nr:adenosine kinase [Pseudochelatococcus contaminans]MBB3809348.1 adenosine kinase [Pseudochelatococcus contaminans]
MTTRYDVLGIGNAIVDVISREDDDFLVAQNLVKGSMQLIDEARARQLFDAMGPATHTSGGSAANTVAGLASLGAKPAFIGKVKDDEAGARFAHDIRSLDVAFPTAFAKDGPATAMCLIAVTPDGERTMSTYLGASQHLDAEDIDRETVEAAAITYLEGYLWDPAQAKEAFVKAARIAHGADRLVALTLSDSFCVERYREEFISLLRTQTVDIVFANEAELKSRYETSDFDAAVTALREETVLGVVTRSEKGALVVTREESLAVPASPIHSIVDSTGAGDLFAAGFLYGLSHDLDVRTAAHHGSLAAAHIIQQVGARPQKNLRQHAIDNGLAVSAE